MGQHQATPPRLPGPRSTVYKFKNLDTHAYIKLVVLPTFRDKKKAYFFDISKVIHQHSRRVLAQVNKESIGSSFMEEKANI